MTITTIPFLLNRKPGIVTIVYEAAQRAEKSGFDLFASSGFDISKCIGYPAMRAYISSYEGTGYYTASAWVQIVTRREFTSIDAAEPAAVVPAVDTHPILAELGVPFFAQGFPAEIFDAPCDNLNGLAKLEWIADTFLVTLPSRVNDFTVSRIAGFRWGYCEYDLDSKRQVNLMQLTVTNPEDWESHLPLLRSQFSRWKFC